MNKFKFDAFLLEFPALDKALINLSASLTGEPNLDGDALLCEGIKIKRMTAELLGRTPLTNEHEGSCVGIDEGDAVWLVSRSGQLHAVTGAHSFQSNRAHTDGYKEPGETLLEAVSRYGLETSLAQIVWVEFGLTTVDHYSQDDWCAVIYKPAKDVDVNELVAQARSKALAQVKAEGTF